MIRHLLGHKSNTGGLTLLIILRCVGKYVNVYKSRVNGPINLHIYYPDSTVVDYVSLTFFLKMCY